MRRFGWQWLVSSSLLLLGLVAAAETRPQYGGTLRIAMHAAFTSLDPADNSQSDSFARRNVTLLIFETLVNTDDRGRTLPALAASWQTYPPNQGGNQKGVQRWEFRLRQDVKFHDGTPLSPEIAASSLRTANPSWNIFAAADSLVIERDAGDLELPTELALARNAIVKRNPDGTLSGTGPFHVREWQAGKKLSLDVEESYWGGRSFLDGVEIEMGRNIHDQLLALELGRTDLVEVPPEQSHRISAEGRNVASSAPIELMALLFSREAQSPEEESLRQALALSVDRLSMRNVLLQGAGQAAGGILPNWISGYGFVFPTEADLSRARHVRGQVRKVPTWTLGYDAGDSVARVSAERIALNPRDAGLLLQPTTAGSADLRLARIPLASADPWISLANVGDVCGLPRPKMNGGAAEDLYVAERAMLATLRLIPLFHLPINYAAAPTLKNWSPRLYGGWNLADAWLGSEKP